MNLDTATLPSVPFEERRALPTVAVVYFVLDEAGSVLYVGKSINMKQRWAVHHLLPALRQMHGIRLAWSVCDDPSLLESVETDCIRDIDPPMNVRGTSRSVRLIGADVAVAKLVIRHADPDLWRRVRSEAIRHNLPSGTLLNEIIREWMEANGMLTPSPPSQ